MLDSFLCGPEAVGGGGGGREPPIYFSYQFYSPLKRRGQIFPQGGMGDVQINKCTTKQEGII